MQQKSVIKICLQSLVVYEQGGVMRGTQHFPQQNENCILGDSNFKQIRLITYHAKVQVFSFDRNNFKKHVDSNTVPSRV